MIIPLLNNEGVIGIVKHLTIYRMLLLSYQSTVTLKQEQTTKI